MLRSFVPARDHDQSRRFYEALGFSTEYVDESIAIMSNGTDSFSPHNFYVKELAENFMLQLSVADAHNWWAEHDPVQLAEKFGTKPPISSSVQPWCLVVGFIHDPCGVLLRLTQGPRHQHDRYQHFYFTSSLTTNRQYLAILSLTNNAPSVRLELF